VNKAGILQKITCVKTMALMIYNQEGFSDEHSLKYLFSPYALAVLSFISFVSWIAFTIFPPSSYSDAGVTTVDKFAH
jgi:hypothetical protein